MQCTTCHTQPLKCMRVRVGTPGAMMLIKVIRHVLYLGCQCMRLNFIASCSPGPCTCYSGCVCMYHTRRVHSMLPACRAVTADAAFPDLLRHPPVHVPCCTLKNPKSQSPSVEPKPHSGTQTPLRRRCSPPDPTARLLGWVLSPIQSSARPSRLLLITSISSNSSTNSDIRLGPCS